MLKLKMPNEKANYWLSTVDHDRFQEALEEHWHVDEHVSIAHVYRS